MFWKIKLLKESLSVQVEVSRFQKGHYISYSSKIEGVRGFGNFLMVTRQRRRENYTYAKCSFRLGVLYLDKRTFNTQLYT